MSIQRKNNGLPSTLNHVEVKKKTNKASNNQTKGCCGMLTRSSKDRRWRSLLCFPHPGRIGAIFLLSGKWDQTKEEGAGKHMKQEPC